jgi:hypothetical protein
MISAISGPSYPATYPRDGAAVFAQAAPAVPTATAPTYGAQQNGGMEAFSTFASKAFSALSAFFTKVVDWLKGLFGAKTDIPTGEVLTPEETAIAQRYSLQPSKANIAAFRTEVSSYAANGTLGPGVNNPDAVKQLQMALARIGYQVQVSGQYDPATVAAVTKFKQDAGLRQTYRASTGNFAVNEYATPDVVAALIERLRRVLGQ